MIFEKYHTKLIFYHHYLPSLRTSTSLIVIIGRVIRSDHYK